MADLTLPGDIPGLLRPGCPVIVDGLDHGVAITHVYGEERGDLIDIGRITRGDRTVLDCEMPIAAVALALTDEAGADRAARWLAERLGMRSGATSGRWSGCRHDGFPFWRLDTQEDDVRMFGAEYQQGWEDQGMVVPALASIDLAHPQADLLALRAVCLHVAGRTP
jgi:hypothetical protein